MVHQSLKKLIKKTLDGDDKLSKKFKSKLKRELDNLPDCVSFKTALETVSGYVPLPIQGTGNELDYKTPACGTQPYCETLKEIGRCNKEQCFFSTHY